MPDIHIPDVSEFQDRVDFAAVGPAVILRAHNGYRADHTFAARRADAHTHGLRAVGLYCYLVKDRDAAVQAHEAAAVIGRLQPGEMVWVDVEEGSGDQSSRAETFAREIDSACGGHAGIYSGESFLTDHLRGTYGRRIWVAAYRTSEPTATHALWQHSDREPHRGVSGPCDCSIFHGSADDLRTLFGWPPATKPAPGKPTPAKAKATPNAAQVQATQQAVHVTADGAWGPETDQAVSTVRTYATSGGRPNVWALQKAVGTQTDGAWGPGSAQAARATIAKLQKAWGAPSDGTWGPKTEAAYQAARKRSYR